MPRKYTKKEKSQRETNKGWAEGAREDFLSQYVDEFANAMEKWTSVARRVGGRRQSGSARTGSGADRDQLRKMREWAKENGYNVSSRGRISQEIQDAYHAAN